MNTLKSISLGFSLIVGTAASSLTAGEGGGPGSTNLPPCCVKLPGAVAVSDSSLYQLESQWTNDAARQVSLGTLAGRPQVVTMFFASCIYACPILVHDMKRIEAAFPEELREKVGFTLITFDSERDTPEVLAAFRKQHGLAANWTLLRAESDDVLELAALLGVKFKKEPSGQFAHSNIITVLNDGGEIISRQAGLNVDPSTTVSAVRQLLDR